MAIRLTGLPATRYPTEQMQAWTVWLKRVVATIAGARPSSADEA